MVPQKVNVSSSLDYLMVPRAPMSTQVSLAAALHPQSKGSSFCPHLGRFVKLFVHVGDSISQ